MLNYTFKIGDIAFLDGIKEVIVDENIFYIDQKYRVLYNDGIKMGEDVFPSRLFKKKHEKS